MVQIFDAQKANKRNQHRHGIRRGCINRQGDSNLYYRWTKRRREVRIQAIKEKEKQSKRKAKKIEILPLDPINYKILAFGVVTVILGYVALGMDPWDGVMALTVAPILLVFGYCVIIPVGIIYRKKKGEVPSPMASEQPTETAPQS